MKTEDRVDEQRTMVERAILPLALPLAALVVIEIIVLAFAQILLTVGKTPAVFIALAVAVAILAAGAALSAAPRLKASSITAVLVLGLLATIGGGLVAAQVGYAPIPGHDEGAGHGGDAAATVVADNLVFDVSTITLPAGKETIVAFDNQDEGIPHNIAIYETDALDVDLFVGEIFNGVQTVEYTVPALDEGEYFFQCDVHPNMKGTVVVSGSAQDASH